MTDETDTLTLLRERVARERLDHRLELLAVLQQRNPLRERRPGAKNFTYALLICVCASGPLDDDGWLEPPQAASENPTTTTSASRLTTRA